jgi:hypothetical protein
MSKEDRDAIRQAAAKALAWELYATAGYGRTRSRVSVEDFDRELRSAARKWNATRKNLNRRKEHQP